MRRADRPRRMERVLCCCLGEDFLARVCECIFRVGRETGVSYKPIDGNDEDDWSDEDDGDDEAGNIELNKRRKIYEDDLS